VITSIWSMYDYIAYFVRERQRPAVAVSKADVRA
jgi:hypothetical protein